MNAWECDVTISCVMMTGSLNKCLDLEELSKMMPNSEYHPKRYPHYAVGTKSFAAIKMTNSSPYVKVSFFSTGTFNVTGAASVEQTNAGVDAIVERITACPGFENVVKQEIRVTNIKADAVLNIGNKRVNLGKMVQLRPRYVQYETESFPALKLWTDLYKNEKIMVFASGSCNLTGFKDEASIIVAFKTFYKMFYDKDIFW